MDFSRRVAFLAALALLVAAGLAGTAGRSAAETAKRPRLAAFGSCGQLLDYAKSNAGRFVGPYGLGSPLFRGGVVEATRAAAPQQEGVDYSGTNVQEEGVDEPDIVKTDGSTLFAVSAAERPAAPASTAAIASASAARNATRLEKSITPVIRHTCPNRHRRPRGQAWTPSRLL